MGKPQRDGATHKYIGPSVRYAGVDCIQNGVRVRIVGRKSGLVLVKDNDRKTWMVSPRNLEAL